MRKYGKVDTNHRAIVDALRASGALVISLASQGGGVPDILVYTGSRSVTGEFKLLEVKGPNGKLTEDQSKFMVLGWPVHIVRSPQGALDAVWGVERGP